MLSTKDVAKICHQANKAYCEAIGDNSQQDWDETSDWQQDADILGVKFVTRNPEAPASFPRDILFKSIVNSLEHGD